MINLGFNVDRYLEQEGFEPRTVEEVIDMLSDLKKQDVKEWLLPVLDADKDGEESQRDLYNVMAMRLEGHTIYDLFKSKHFAMNKWIMEKSIKYGKLEAGKRVLDVGCGTGLEAVMFGKIIGERGEVVGIDISPEMIKRARERAISRETGNVRFVEGSRINIPLEAGYFDSAFCIQAFTEGATQTNYEDEGLWPQYVGVRSAEQINRVMKKEGRLCVFQPSTSDMHDCVRELAGSYLTSGGFEIVHAEPYVAKDNDWASVMLFVCDKL